MAAAAIKSNQVRGLRLITSVPVLADNSQFTIDIPRGPAVETVGIHLFGTISLSVTGTATRNAAAYRMLSKCDFVLNSNVTFDSISGQQLAALYFTRRNLPLITNPAFGVGATSFDVTFLFDRVGLDMVRPKDCVLKTDVGVANLQLRIQLGALSSMYTGAPTYTYTTVTMEVFVIDYQEQKAADGTTPTPKFYLKRTGQTQAIGGASTQNQYKLNTGNRLRAVSVRTLVPATGEPSTAAAPLMTRFGIKRAGDQRVDISASALAVLNSSQYDASASGLMTGQYVWDFANVGQTNGSRYSEFWPIPSSADTFLVIDVNAATTLDIAVMEGVDL